MREKSEIVLSALLSGQTIHLLGRDCILAEDEKENSKFCFIGKKYDGDKFIDEVYLPIELSLDCFIKECNKISDEEICLIIANKVLSEKGDKNVS